MATEYLTRNSRNLPTAERVDGRVDVYAQSSTQQYPLWASYWDRYGRRFRYVKNGAVALTRALMTQSAVQDSKAFEIAQTGHAQVVGSRKIDILVTTGGGWDDDAFAGGFLVCNKVSPATVGDIYAIRSSALDSTDTILHLELDSPWRNAMLATGEVTLTFNPGYKVIVHPTTTATAPAAGVPLIDVTIGYYAWVQTKGTAPLVVDTGDTLVIGQPVGCPTTSAVAGAGGVIADGNVLTTAYSMTRVWGHVRSLGTAAEPALVDLCLE